MGEGHDARDGNMSIRILLADDHQIMRNGLRTLLDKEPDLEVVAEAGNAQTTMRLARDLAPEVVIMDLAMPDVNGLDVIREVAAASPSVKIVGMSIHSDRRLAVNVLKAGAAGYLLKDCAFEELARAIREVVCHKTYISQGLSDLVVQDYLEALRESEARFRTIFKDATIGMALVDLDGYIVESNPALQKMLGYSREELHYKPFYEFTPEEDAQRCLNYFQEMVEGKRASFQMEKAFVRKNGRMGWGRLTVSPFRDDRKELRFAIGMVEDITEQKQSEEEIRSYQEQLRSMASDLSLTGEHERRRLATELHDQVGQILALIQIKLGGLRESVSSTHLAAPLDEIRRLLEQSIRFTRSLTFELSPPILYDLGFEAAVEWLADLMHEQYGIPIQVNRDGYPPQPLNDDIRVLLFQAVRELLVNVVKHAKARQVQISMAKEGKNLKVVVGDDGVGFAPSPGNDFPGPQGFGLFSIRERLKYLGGQLEMLSGLGQGTQVALMVPLRY